ncbi:hypothetical protein EXIGLDRAFT_232330 [Exidia glandulosa HHB12029]|uniref:Uncharacterized protein n=1 Tax=Exidia glandulosa HHB12029 TaxID=1314781 RepID=A0A165E4H4_EXIGL|nr:hypothetical protein EXIGLDRAFT_232330 [Exidia glandulosa HHB12029]
MLVIFHTSPGPRRSQLGGFDTVVVMAHFLMISGVVRVDCSLRLTLAKTLDARACSPSTLPRSPSRTRASKDRTLQPCLARYLPDNLFRLLSTAVGDAAIGSQPSPSRLSDGMYSRLPLNP